MIIERVQIDAFGAVSDFELSSLAEGLTLVHGPNEAGKSTLLAFIRFVLFGFRRGDARYQPPAGSRHGGRLWLRDAQGTYVLERMAGRPPVVRAESGAPAGEQALRRMLEQIDENLFRSIFAFSLTELSDFSSLSGEEVERRLFSGAITGAGSRAGEAVQQLQKRKERLVRARSRDALVNALLEELDGAEARLRQAQADAAGFAELSVEVEAAAREQVELRAARTQALSEKAFYLGLHELWEPFQRYIQRRADLEAMGTPRISAEQAEAVRLLDRARVETESAAASAREALAQRERTLAEVMVQPELEAIAADVRRLDGGRALQEERLRDLRDVESRLLGERERLEDTARGAGVSPDRAAAADAALLQYLRDTSQDIALLQQRAADAESRLPQLELAFRQARADEMAAEGGEAGRLSLLQALLEGAETIRRERSRGLLAWLLALALALVGAAGAALRVWPLVAAFPVGLGGILYLTLGPDRGRLRKLRQRQAQALVEAGLQDFDEIALLKEVSRLQLQQGPTNLETLRLLRRRAEQEYLQVEEQFAGHGRQREAKEEEARARFAEIGLETHLRCAEAEPALQALSAQAAEIRRLERERGRLHAMLLEWQEQVQAALRAAGLDGAPSVEECIRAVSDLAKKVQAAENARALHRALEDEANRAKTGLDLADEALSQASAAEIEALSALGIPELDAWRRTEAELERHLQLEAEVRDLLRPIELRLSDARVRAALESGSPEEWSARAELLEQDERRISDAYDAAVRRLVQIEERRGRLLGSDEIPVLEAQAAALREEIRRALGRYMEAALGKHLIEETLDRYIRTRQPDVLRLASAVFARITEDRYARVVQTAAGLKVETPSGVQRPPAELSRGTAEQLYLSIRLGLAATYMDGGIALPLVMDDVLVNFDPGRTERVLSALGSYAQEPGRQVLLFTCHPFTRDMGLRASPGARAVELGELQALGEVAAAIVPSATDLLSVLTPVGRTLREIAQLLGRSPEECREEMGRLIASGRVVPEGRGRGMRYRMAPDDA